MIIFGWGGGRVKDHGPALPQACPSCGREGFLHYFTVTKWFRLYFIPLIPYSTTHFLACPICTAGTELTTPAERQRIHSLVAAAASFGSGLIGADAYEAHLRATFGEVAAAPALPPTPPPPPAGTAPRLDTPRPTNQIQPGQTWPS